MKGSPRFPTYHGPPLPEALNPLNPHHYWLLLKWISFQPSRLKHYLYRADPGLYRAKGLRALAQTVRFSAYRNLYLMAIVLILLLSGSTPWIASAIQGTPVDWWSVEFGVAFGLAVGVAFGVAGGVAGGVVFGAVGGVLVGVVGGVVSGVAYGMASGVADGMILGAVVGVVFGVVVGVGSSRLLFYPFELLPAWFRSRSAGEPFLRLAHHPALWDELAVWPLPGTDHLLRACLATDLSRGSRLVVRVAANPFQRWAVQRALSDFIAGQPEPLAVLYRLVYLPMLDEYLIPPASRLQFQRYPSARLVLLGEIGRQFVAASSESGENSERLVWQLTRRWRRMEVTPLSQFSAMLYELIRTEAELESIDVHEINLAERPESAYEGVRQFKYGDEITDSFAAFASFLDACTIEALATAHQHLDWVDALAEPPLRPTVIEALKALGDVSRQVAAFARATNTGQKSAVLNRAAGALNELAGYVQREILLPERVLLARAVELWQSVVAAEQGKLGKAALREMTPAARRAAGIVERTSAVWRRPATPFDNPYVVGDPVYPPLLVGRKNVFDRIGEVWAAKENPDSIILYGHRRMGKSSILRNLDQVAPPVSVIVYVDMAGETSFVASTADLLLELANRIYTAVRRAYPEARLPEPDPETYNTPPRAQFQLNQLVERVRDALAGHTLILALDEFEAVEYAVEADKIGKEIYQFLRAKTQEPWLTLVFGGLHTLDEMSRDYQQPFYGSYENIRVSYLAHDDAWRLITNPTSDFDLNYEPEVVERIIAETGRQPYLVQQVCRDAVDHLNHELFDLDMEREVLIKLSDVEAVLGDDFFRRGTGYFDGVWTQASHPDQRTLLRVMAGCDGSWGYTELETATRLNPDALRRELRWAERHDILHKVEADPPVWEFYVPLMRRWVRRTR